MLRGSYCKGSPTADSPRDVTTRTGSDRTRCQRSLNTGRSRQVTYRTGPASENPLLGTWRLKTYVVATAAGERRPTPYGENPTGYLSYSADGRMQAIAAAKGRIVPVGAAPPDNQRVALYDTMFAYAGTYSYSVEAGTVIHHVDISWNETWTGTDQIRHFEVSGNTLTLTTRITDPASGTEAHYAVVWEKVPSPCRAFP